MSEGTSIAWATDSLNACRIRNRRTGKVGWHCAKLSPGCANCYSDEIDDRFGLGLPYNAGSIWELDIEPFLDLNVLRKPLHWRSDRRRRVFWESMNDLFLESHPDEWIDAHVAIAALTPWVDHLFLTKRAERLQSHMEDCWKVLGRQHEIRNWINAIADLEGMSADSLGVLKAIESVSGTPAVGSQPLPNLWLGVSVESREYLSRIDHLLRTPAAIRFVSFEPLLEDLGKLPRLDSCSYYCDHGDQYPEGHRPERIIDWAILGLESGSKRRDPGVEPLEALAHRLKSAGVAVFTKQDCARLPGQRGRISDEVWALKEFPR